MIPKAIFDEMHCRECGKPIRHVAGGLWVHTPNDRAKCGGKALGRRAAPITAGSPPSPRTGD